MLRVHCQNRAAETDVWRVSPALFAAAAARHPDLAVEVSHGGTPGELRQGMADADILIGTAGVIRSCFPVEAPRLKWIFATSAGVDKLVPFDWLPPGVVLVNNSGAHSPKAGEFSQMALLMLHHRMPALYSQQRAARWAKQMAGGIAGRTLLVLGLGGIGGAAAEAGQRLGMRVIGLRNTPAPHPACAEVIGPAELDVRLPEADIVLIALPLTPATTRLLDAARLDRLKPGAGLINLARGRVIDNEALAGKLARGELSGALLDVFDEEPLPPGSPLWTTPNLIVTPHISSEDPDNYIPRSLDIFFDNLRCWTRGQPMPNLVDPVRGY